MYPQQQYISPEEQQKQEQFNQMASLAGITALAGGVGTLGASPYIAPESWAGKNIGAGYQNIGDVYNNMMNRNPNQVQGGTGVDVVPTGGGMTENVGNAGGMAPPQPATPMQGQPGPAPQGPPQQAPVQGQQAPPMANPQVPDPWNVPQAREAVAAAQRHQSGQGVVVGNGMPPQQQPSAAPPQVQNSGGRQAMRSKGGQGFGTKRPQGKKR